LTGVSEGASPQARARAASRLHPGAAAPDVAFCLKDELAVRGVKVSHNEVWLFLRREGLRFKKKRYSSFSRRSDVARRRRHWRSWQALIDPRRLVFIDETWIKTSMALRGWGPTSTRLSGFAPHRHWRIMTFSAPCAATSSPPLV
jgi:hypothetical protein